jgi:hypothetical protein
MGVSLRPRGGWKDFLLFQPLLTNHHAFSNPRPWKDNTAIIFCPPPCRKADARCRATSRYNPCGRDRDESPQCARSVALFSSENIEELSFKVLMRVAYLSVDIFLIVIFLLLSIHCKLPIALSNSITILQAPQTWSSADMRLAKRWKK